MKKQQYLNYVKKAIVKGREDYDAATKRWRESFDADFMFGYTSPGHISSQLHMEGLIFSITGEKEYAEKEIGLEIGRFGVKVNEYQETSDPDILAGGDCVEKFNFITKKPTPGQLRGPAVVQGRLAAKRLAGFDIKFPGVLDAGGCKIFDMTITATGFTEEKAAMEGIETVSAIVDSRSKHAMIPGTKPWKIKLVFDKKTQKVVGGQIVSHAIAPAREIDAVTAFILGEKTIEELTTFTSACNPDISSEPSAEPITIAAELALQKLNTI